ncbi:MAG: hypothetical protein U0P45_08395 [Acidimicrobiales bacterium]
MRSQVVVEVAAERQARRRRHQGRDLELQGQVVVVALARRRPVPSRPEPPSGSIEVLLPVRSQVERVGLRGQLVQQQARSVADELNQVIGISQGRIPAPRKSMQRAGLPGQLASHTSARQASTPIGGAVRADVAAEDVEGVLRVRDKAPKRAPRPAR